MEEGKDFLKPLDNSCSSETDTSLTMLTAAVTTDVAADINLGSLGDMSDTLNTSEDHTVSEDNTDQQIKVDSVLSTTPTTLFQENLVLVETSKGLVLTNLDSSNFSNNFVTSGPDSRGHTVISSSLPTTIPVFSTLVGAGDDNQVTMYGTVGEGNVLIPANIFQDADSTSELQTSISVADSNTEGDAQPKKRKGLGGWPKGKKRKPTPDVTVPRKPMTGYVIFASQRRQEIKVTNPELAFPEVTKQMGQEWSHMREDDKQRYLKLAQEDKQRYINEMQDFQKSVQFQTYLKNKRRNNDLDSCLTDDGKGLIDLEEEEDLDELYCKVCNQYFISAHNKKEHMFGRQHLQNITNEIIQAEQLILASDSIDPTLSITEKSTESENSRKDSSLDINEFIQDFMSKNKDRDKEIRLLRKSHKTSLEDNFEMSKQVKELEEYESKLDQDLGSLKAYGASLAAQVDALKMVPTLFGVINF
ncbi:high mobility group protein 20A-like [Mercenaria mercenaria]|uniref:high mobility group protein 20A-like n=1 Tax=Mercenaria mercenaria TaxID=6596 RepID=UPI00234F8B3D|nr:high mobility group protein 20A-like [Mercenaria mercenaria]